MDGITTNNNHNPIEDEILHILQQMPGKGLFGV
jgi:hypothetical protein